MFEPILLTKLFIPPLRSGIVPRPQLVSRLNHGQEIGCKLILISAPAGFGKTTLVSEWLANNNHLIAWLSLDENDASPSTFLAYLISTLQRIQPGIGESLLGLLGSAQEIQVPGILTHLLNEIAALPEEFLLILDDYHAIDSSQVDKLLQFIIEHQPSQMHLVVLSREDPDLPLADLRARGQCLELRAADLRFTSLEAADFLNKLAGLNLTESDVSALEARTEGWIAGLQMAAISMSGRSDASSFISSFTGSHRFVMDYLVEEVLDRLPKNLQTFLLGTSILDRFCSPLCDAMFADPSIPGQETLEEIEKRNLFIFPLDHERRWYRYHHLFADLLRQRLGQRLSPGERSQYHLRASVWFEENNEMSEAFQHAIAAGDFRRAGNLAEAVWPEMDTRFQSAAWLGWTKKLPDSEILIRPVLCVNRALAFMDAGLPDESEIWLRNAERRLDGPPAQMVYIDENQLKSLPAMIAITRAYNAQVQGDYENTIRYSELAIRLLPDEELVKKAQAQITLDVTHWSYGDIETARSGMDNWMKQMHEAGNYFFVIASAFAMSDLLVALGQLREAARIIHQALILTAQYCPEAEPITAHHYLGLAMIAHERNDSSTFVQNIQKAQELGKQTTLVDWPYRWNLAQSALSESQGDLNSALEFLEEARKVFVKTPIPVIHPIDALKARIFLRLGELDKIRDWIRSSGLTTDDQIDYLNEFEHLILARLLIAEKAVDHLDSVIEMLDRMLISAQKQKRVGSILDILVVRALAFQAQNDLPLAMNSLEQALSIAEPEGYIRLFVDEGKPIRELVEILTQDRKNPLRNYCSRLQTAFKQTDIRRNSMVSPINQDLIDPLSERELEVLKLLRTELGGPEIARQLVVSLNTFRTHTRSIFNKLGVKTRMAAVRRAEDLGLF